MFAAADAPLRPGPDWIHAQWELGALQDAGNTTTLAHYLRLLESAFAGGDFAAARADRPWWGRLVENAVGAHLLNGLDPATHRLFYWRERDREADFVVRGSRGAWARVSGRGAAGSGSPPS